MAQHRKGRAVLSPELTLAYETHGDPAHPTVLLVHGHGMQLLGWRREDLVDRFVAAGFHVVRYDNRDIGLSSRLEHCGDCKSRPVTITLGKFWNAALDAQVLGRPLPLLLLLLLLLHAVLSSDGGLLAATTPRAAAIPALWLACRITRRGYAAPPDPAPSYSIGDMAADAIALLDHLRVESTGILIRLSRRRQNLTLSLLTQSAA